MNKNGLRNSKRNNIRAQHYRNEALNWIPIM